MHPRTNLLKRFCPSFGRVGSPSPGRMSIDQSGLQVERDRDLGNLRASSKRILESGKPKSTLFGPTLVALDRVD